ncbi:MAG: molybdenum cofactor guanylyltransferase [Actinomycetota bacterium]|nr:molybdenum cofactor guanylyltransferase [Actinomycetota bacterium]
MASSPGQEAEVPALTGLVLAGGRGRRLGRDKAFLEVDGEALVVRAARRLERCCEEVLVASGDGSRLGELAWEQVADAIADGGPLAGILAGLERATTPLVAVVAVDLPYLHPAVLLRLAVAWRGEAAVVPLVSGRIQPLHGVYATAAAPRMRRLLLAGRRAVIAALSELGARVLGEEGWADLDPSGSFSTNINHPGDLDALRSQPSSPHS